MNQKGRWRKTWCVCGVVALWSLWSLAGVASGDAPTDRKKAKAAKGEKGKKGKAPGRRAPVDRVPGRRAPAARVADRRPAPRRVVPPQPAKPRPPKTKAEKIVEKMVVATGGRKAWAAVRSSKAFGITRLTTMLGTRTAKLVAMEIRPGYQRVDMSFGGQKVIQSHHPKGGWISQNGAIFRLPRSMVEMTRAETVRASLELRYATEKIAVKYLRARKIRGKMCDVIVFVDAKGRRTTYYITVDTSMLLKRSYVGPSPLGTGKKRFTTYHGDFRWVRVGKGKLKVKMPFKVENYIGGRKIGLIQLKRVIINDKSVTKQSFMRPNPTE